MIGANPELAGAFKNFAALVFGHKRAGNQYTLEQHNFGFRFEHADIISHHRIPVSPAAGCHHNQFFFRLNAERFPESGNVWDSLAEGYLRAGDRGKARQYYEKSLEIDPSNENARTVLQDLQ